MVGKVSLKSLESAKISVMTQLPIPLKLKLDEEAEELGIGAAAMVRQIVAEHYGEEVDIVKRGRARKYATDEERKDAQKARDKARRDMIAQLMEAYKSGGEEEALKFLQGQANPTTVEDDSEDSES